VDAVVVGNTAIHHLFLRLPVQQLAAAPYVPAVRAAVDVKAREIAQRVRYVELARWPRFMRNCAEAMYMQRSPFARLRLNRYTCRACVSCIPRDEATCAAFLAL
jgi:hypothetical protein